MPSRRPGPALRRLLRSSSRVLLDTNAFIYYLQGEEPYLTKVLLPFFERVQRGGVVVVVSAITEAELLVKPEQEGNVEAMQRIGDLLSERGIEVAEVTRRIARLAARLRAFTRLKLPDAIILATAVETGCESVVGNDHDWARHDIMGVEYVLLDDTVKGA